MLNYTKPILDFYIKSELVNLLVHLFVVVFQPRLQIRGTSRANGGRWQFMERDGKMERRANNLVTTIYCALLIFLIQLLQKS